MSATGFQPAEPPNPQEVNRSQLEILYVLADGGPTVAREVRERLSELDSSLTMTYSGVHKHLVELEELDLVERESAATNQREKVSSLTKRGLLTVRRDADRRSSIVSGMDHTEHFDGGDVDV